MEVITISPLEIGLIGLLAGAVGTGAGGVISVLTGKPSSKALSVYLGFAGGIMLAIVFAELIPEALEEGSLFLTMVGLILGVILLILLDKFFPHIHHGGGEEGDQKLTKMGYLIAFGIALHNFPEGLAIGAGYSSSAALGYTLAVVIGLHNIPEGLAMAAPLSGAGKKAKIIILATVLAGVPVGIGSYLGAALGHVSAVFLTLSLGFAAGAMLYISFDELLPEAHVQAEGSHYGIYGGVFGVIVGYILIHLL